MSNVKTGVKDTGYNSRIDMGAGIPHIRIGWHTAHYSESAHKKRVQVFILRWGHRT